MHMSNTYLKAYTVIKVPRVWQLNEQTVKTANDFRNAATRGAHSREDIFFKYVAYI